MTAPRVLVGYASAHGSTREIAEHIGRRLREHHLEVDVVDLAHPPARLGHEAFVLGSAVHGQHWLPVARDFLTDHTRELAARPVWLFSVGMPAALRRPFRALGGSEASALAAEAGAVVTFRDHRLFSGVVRADAFGLWGRIALWVFASRAGDHRDWGRIDEWAEGIAEILLALAPSTPRRC